MTTVAATTRLLNPSTFDASGFDPATQRLMRATIDWFEGKGRARIAAETRSDTWYDDFVAFLQQELSEIRTVLTSDAGNEGAFRHEDVVRPGRAGVCQPS